MSDNNNNRDIPLKGLDSELRQMVVDTVHQLRKRLLFKEKILEFDKNELFPEDIIIDQSEGGKEGD